ncbi:hypothetical protein BS78_09G113900 [Paspalum vaginatum]|nr:hypothetical protein BS78_09G113900 [Paspalum vaginatum]
MGKKRAAAVSAAAAPPVFPFPAADAQPDHFSDYGFDPQLPGHFFSSQPEAKRRPWGRRQHQQQPAHSRPLESARFKLQKPITKKHSHQQHLQKQQQRRRWWSSAALLLLNFRRRSSSRPAAAPPPPNGPAASVSVPTAPPLYLADDGGGDDGPTPCACWAPGLRSGRLAAAELGAAGASVPYVSLRSTSLLGGGGNGRAGGGAPAMPIYLVT